MIMFRPVHNKQQCGTTSKHIVLPNDCTPSHDCQYFTCRMLVLLLGVGYKTLKVVNFGTDYQNI